MWEAFTDVFDHLTLSALIDDSIWAVHGGLSPSLHTLDQVRVINRFQELPSEGPFADILWSDPDAKRQGFALSSRGAGYLFGPEPVAKFLRTNKLEHILRAHQLCMDGYQTLFDGTLSTVWSAPNYQARAGNLAAILEISDWGGFVFNTFTAAPASERRTPASDGEGSTTPARLPANYFL